MKISSLKWITTVVAVLMLHAVAKAAIITCSNYPGSPGMTTDLQNACDNLAKDGDTVLISGSTTSYGSVTLNKKLTLLGPGFNPQKDLPLIATTDYIYVNASGCNIQGLKVVYSFYFRSEVSNTTIARNDIVNGIEFSNSTTKGVSIYNNIFGSSGIYSSYSSIQDVLISNNIFGSGDNNRNNSSGLFNYYSTSIANMVVVNNLFIYADSWHNYPTNKFYNCIVSENIFYYTVPTDVLISEGSSSIFSSNIVVGNSNTNPFSVSTNNTNVQSNNFLNANPNFSPFVFGGLGTTDGYVNVYQSSFMLPDNSRFKTASANKDEIGIYGGSYPFFDKGIISGAPGIPQVTKMDIFNHVIAPGDSLKIDLRAKSIK